MRAVLEREGKTSELILPASEMDIRKVRDALGAVDPGDNRFRIAGMTAESPAELCLIGQTVDLDHLNLLARCFDGLDDYEAAKFEAAAQAQGVKDLVGLINLTMNVSRFTLVGEGDTLSDIGRNSFFDLRGGAAVEEIKRTDFLRTALDYLRGHDGIRTERGFLYENDREPFLFFDGRHLPVYADEPYSIGVLLSYGGQTEFLQLPTPVSAIDRAVARLDAPDAKFCTVRADTGSDSEILREHPDIYGLNRALLDARLTEEEAPAPLSAVRVNIYQIAEDPRRVKFSDWEYAAAHGGIKPEEYKCVFRGYLGSDVPDDIFQKLNGDDKPTTYQGHSLSVSDVVEIEGRGAWFCDSVGWKQLDGFDTGLCQEMDGLRCLMLLAHLPPVETRVIDRLESWQNAVSENGEPALMEIAYPFDDSAVLVCNEEFRLNGMEGNRRIDGEAFAGPLYIVGNDDGELCDLTDEQVERYREMYAEPDEDITPEEFEPHMGFYGFDFT